MGWRRRSASPRSVIGSSCSSATAPWGASWRRAATTASSSTSVPSLLILPQIFDELLATAGTTLAAELDVVRLDPQFHYRWPDGAELVVPDGGEETVAAFERFAPGAGAAWRRFDEHGRRIWEISARTFFAGPMGAPWQLLRRMRSPADLVGIDPLRTLHRCAADHFADPRLVQWAGRYATYSGSSPFRAPATLACIPHLESRFGCWYPRGGLDALRAALLGVAGRLGVEIRVGTDVVRIASAGGAVTGVELADGSALADRGGRRQRRRRARLP